MSKSTKPYKPFDMTLSGRNVVRDHHTYLMPTVRTAPGRSYNRTHPPENAPKNHLNIDALLLGHYSPSWRLEKSRDLEPSPRGSTIIRTENDALREFLEKEEEVRLFC